MCVPSLNNVKNVHECAKINAMLWSFQVPVSVVDASREVVEDIEDTRGAAAEVSPGRVAEDIVRLRAGDDGREVATKP